MTAALSRAQPSFLRYRHLVETGTAIDPFALRITDEMLRDGVSLTVSWPMRGND
jgi:hypothetical protein